MATCSYCKELFISENTHPENPLKLFMGEDNLDDKVNQISKQLLAID